MIKLLTNQPNKIRCHDKAFGVSSQSIRGTYETNADRNSFAYSAAFQ